MPKHILFPLTPCKGFFSALQNYTKKPYTRV